MEIETKIISTEIIKPSSPTPKILQKHQLSFIDQSAPPSMAPIVRFYSSNPKIPNSEKTNHLKKSLSQTLSTYYPLAGRLVDNLYIDCNDEGVLFAEAVANCDISQVIINPNIHTIRNRLLCNVDRFRFVLLAVQVTYFKCGGLSVGILTSHKIADAHSMVMFSGAWATATAGGGGGAPPKFDGAAYFPPGEIPAMDQFEEVVKKIFKFSAAEIAVLQKSCGGDGDRKLGRVEALTAYISQRLVWAKGVKSDPNKIYVLNQPINLRSRIDPPMLKHHFGNICWQATAAPTAADVGDEIVRKLREAQKAVFQGFVPQLKDLYELAAGLKEKSGEIGSFIITSMCGFPIYEEDFGWGKPVWVVFAGLPKRDVAIFSDTRSGDGIEVVVCLSKEDMERFEVDLELPILKSNL